MHHCLRYTRLPSELSIPSPGLCSPRRVPRIQHTELSIVSPELARNSGPRNSHGAPAPRFLLAALCLGVLVVSHSLRRFGDGVRDGVREERSPPRHQDAKGQESLAIHDRHARPRAGHCRLRMDGRDKPGHGEKGKWDASSTSLFSIKTGLILAAASRSRHARFTPRGRCRRGLLLRRRARRADRRVSGRCPPRRWRQRSAENRYCRHARRRRRR
jgi:hypothetical protein